MKTFAFLMAVALTSCATATVAVSAAPFGPEPCQATAVAHATPVGAPGADLGEGVWMCTALAARKAGACAEAEDGYRRCQETLKQTEGWDWRPLVTGLAIGVAAGAAAVAGMNEASRR